MLLTAMSFALNANDNLPAFEVKGKIVKKDRAMGLYKVELLFKNTVIDSKFVDDAMPFNFTLPHNRDYIIKISKKGYVTKMVSVNTGMSKFESANGCYKYEFIVEMIEDIKLKSVETGLNDYPNTITEMNCKYTDFNHSRKYTKKVTPLPE